jgi:hypothetical protein
VRQAVGQAVRQAVGNAVGTQTVGQAVEQAVGIVRAIRTLSGSKSEPLENVVKKRLPQLRHFPWLHSEPGVEASLPRRSPYLQEDTATPIEALDWKICGNNLESARVRHLLRADEELFC